MNLNLLLALTLIIISPHVLAKAYRGMNEDGTVYYTDAPLPEAFSKTQEIRMDEPPPPKQTQSDGKHAPVPATSADKAPNQPESAVDPVNKAEVAEKCKKTKQLFAGATQQARELIQKKRKNGKVSKSELDKAEKNLDQIKEPEQQQCETDYASGLPLKKLVDCFANAESEAEAGLFCVVFTETVADEPEKP